MKKMQLAFCLILFFFFSCANNTEKQKEQMIKKISRNWQTVATKPASTDKQTSAWFDDTGVFKAVEEHVHDFNIEYRGTWSFTPQLDSVNIAILYSFGYAVLDSIHPKTGKPIAEASGLPREHHIERTFKIITLTDSSLVYENEQDGYFEMKPKK